MYSVCSSCFWTKLSRTWCCCPLLGNMNILCNPTNHHFSYFLLKLHCVRGKKDTFKVLYIYIYIWNQNDPDKENVNISADPSISAVCLNVFICVFMCLFTCGPPDDLFTSRVSLPPPWMMPRSFLVKRGGLHHPRPTAGSPSPGSTPVTLSQLKNKMGPWDTTLECSTAEAPCINTVSITLLQQDRPATSPSNGSGNPQPLRAKSFGGWQSYFLLCIDPTWDNK